MLNRLQFYQYNDFEFLFIIQLYKVTLHQYRANIEFTQYFKNIYADYAIQLNKCGMAAPPVTCPKTVCNLQVAPVRDRGNPVTKVQS